MERGGSPKERGGSPMERGSSPMDLSGRSATKRRADAGRVGLVEDPAEAHGGDSYRKPFAGTHPEPSQVSARSVSQASGVTGANATDRPLGGPIISRVGEMPDSIRASARSPEGTTAVRTEPGPAAATAPAAGRPTKAPLTGTAVGPSTGALATPTDRSTAGASPVRPSLDGGRSDGGRADGGRGARPSAGQLFSGVAADISTLIRKEVDLAKAEVRQSATRAGKGAGMFGGAAGAAAFAVLFLLLAAMFGLAEVMALGWAALIVAGILLVSAAVLGLVALRTVKKVHPAPTQTVETLKEDVRWASGLRK